VRFQGILKVVYRIVPSRTGYEAHAAPPEVILLDQLAKETPEAFL
jgi:hypothetical protein